MANPTNLFILPPAPVTVPCEASTEVQSWDALDRTLASITEADSLRGDNPADAFLMTNAIQEHFNR